MEGRKKYDPQKRKPIHSGLAYNEIRDNVKNDAIMAQNRLRRRNQRLELDDDRGMSSSDDENTDYSDEEEESLDVRSEETTRRNVAQSGPRTRLIKEPVPKLQAKLSTTPTAPKPDTSSILLKTVVKHPNTRNQVKNCNHNWWKFLTAAVVFLLVLAFTSGGLNRTIFHLSNSGRENSIHSQEHVLDNVKQTLRSLGSKYKNQNKDLWQSAYQSISELIRRPHKPSIILLLGDKSDPLDCLAILLGNVSSNALNSGRLTLTPSQFNHDMGSVIEDLRVRIRNHKAVVIWDLLNINVEALKAFHNLCDRINPLVEEAIFIITIVADNVDKAKSPLDFVEKELFKKLSGNMKDDAIQPLITRITDGPILLVKPEPTVTDCPLPKFSKN